MDLEPCPICRSAQTKLQQGNEWAFVECRECGTAGPTWEDPDEAEVSWNTRVPDPELATTRAQLAEALGALEKIANGPDNRKPAEFLLSAFTDKELARQVLAKIKGGE